METERRLRVGAFGVGRMGRVHLEHLVQLAREERIDFTAIGDRREATLDSSREFLRTTMGHEVRCFATPEEMTSGGDLDAVVIASRTEDHARDTLAFVQRGIRVLVEKPLANSVADAVEFARATGRDGAGLVQVAFQRHYDAATQTAKRWVSENQIGKLQQSHHVLQDKNPTPPAYQSPGITSDMAVHLVYEALSFRDFALPRYVQALRFLAPFYEDRAKEGANIVHVFCEWPDGSLAHLWGSRINGTGYDNGFTLIGTDGRIDAGEFVGDFGPISAKLWRGTGTDGGPRGVLTESLEFPMSPPLPRHPDFYARYGAAYRNELAAFLDRVRAGQPFEVGIEVGWRSLLVANAAEESSRRGGHRFELMLEDGRPIGSIDDASRYAAQAGIE